MSGEPDYPQGCLPILKASNVSLSQQTDRLRILANALYDCKQNNDDDVKQPHRFMKLFAHLSQNCFLDNSNTDFRIYLSLCLANILRIFQPEIPTATPLDLKNVYLHIFRTLKTLGEVTTDNPKFKHLLHLVEAVEKILHPLSEMRDHEESEALPVVRTLIKEILSLACGKGWKKNKEAASKEIQEKGEDDEEEEEENSFEKVEKTLVAIGTTAISEFDLVPNEILDVLFHHIISPQREDFKEAREIAQKIIRSCMESENNPLAQAIQNIMTSAGKEGRFPEEFKLTGSSDRGKYFEVLRCLHNIDFELVSVAVEELNFWLQSENEAYRCEAVKIVGSLSYDRTCQFGTDSTSATWSAFLNASADPEPRVRLEFVGQSKIVLISNNSHLRGQIINSLIRLSMDSVEEVRAEVVSAVTEVAKCKLEVISDKILKACADRMKDKRPKVRICAIKCLMDLYCHVMTNKPLSCLGLIKLNNSAMVYTESDKECVRFIPNAVFHLCRLTQKVPAYQDARLQVERYLQLNFVPYRLDAEQRVRVMADLFRNLDDISVVMFGDIINRSSQLRRAMIGIMSQIGRSSDTPTPEYSFQLKERIRRIVQIFPEPTTLEKCLMTFVNQMAENEETFNTMRQLMGDNYTCADSVAASTTVKKLMEKKFTGKTVAQIFRHFIDRISPVSFDTPVAKEIVKLVAETVTAKFQMKKWAENYFERDLVLLKLFTEHFGHIFTDESIVEEIRSSMLNTEEPRAVEAGLDALTKIFNNTSSRSRLENESTKKEKWFMSVCRDLKELIMRSDPLYRRSCKLATRLLACLLGKEKAVEYFEGIIESLIDRLDLESEGAANAFQVLGEIFSTDPNKFLPNVINVIESDRIGSSLLSSPLHHEDDPVEFNDLIQMEKQPWPKYSMAKVYAAKFVTNVMLEYGKLKDNGKWLIEKAVQPFVDVLDDIIMKKGDLGGNQCNVEKARLRAVAAGCLLKIAQIFSFRKTISTELYTKLSYQITDEAYCVRLHYALHIKKALSRKLSIEFAACYGLVNLGLSDEEGEKHNENFKAMCVNHAQQVFSDRNEEKADLLKLEGTARVIFCAETVVAYVVWLLIKYEKFEKVEDNIEKTDDEEVQEEKLRNVNLLAQLQEQLWLVLDALRHANCNMQKVWKILEKLKCFGDKSVKMDTKWKAEKMREHNKKLWALSDLGIVMMLYRAKLQMEDREFKHGGYNLQFFYTCSERDKSDPSNCYAPDVLVNDEKQRNGKLPKPGQIFTLADLTSEWTPQPDGNATTSSSGSTTLKNVSRRGAGKTTNTKAKRGGGKKRKSGENEESDREETKITLPTTKKTRSRRSAYDMPEEEEEDDDVQEVMPIFKRRGNVPSTSNSANTTNDSKNGIESPKKRTSRGNGTAQKTSRRTVVEVEEESEENEEDEIGLGDVLISPIFDESKGRTRRSARTIAATATLTSSTPLVAPKPKVQKRKREDEIVIEKEGEEEAKEVPHSPKPTPKRKSGRRAPAKVTSPAKSPASKKTRKNEPTTSSTPKTNQYGLPMDEEDQELSASSAPPLRTRSSARLSKK